MITSLITGGAGFIGSHVSIHCLTLKHRVIIIDDLSGGKKSNIPSGAIFLQGSITDRTFLRSIFEKYKINYVYHLAAYAAEGLSHFIRNFNYTNNLIGSVNLINLSVEFEVKCFVFTSSIAVYGSSQLPMDERMKPEPEDPYGIAKYAVELDLEAARKMFGLNYIVFRPHNVYGENQNIGDRYRNVIGIFINQLMKGEGLTVFGNGNQTRAFSYIDDVAPIISNSINVSSAYNEVFNIGGNEVCSINELIKFISEEFKTTPKIIFCASRNETEHAYSSHEKINEYFILKTNTSIQTGIRKMILWAVNQGIQSTNKFSNIEVLKNMPVIWQE